MPRFEQVRGRYRPTCFECISAQHSRDSCICTFADSLRYPPLQETPAQVPRLIAAPPPPPSSELPPNNRVRASDRRAVADRRRIRLPPPAGSRYSVHLLLRSSPAASPPAADPRSPSTPQSPPPAAPLASNQQQSTPVFSNPPSEPARTFAHNHYWIGQDAWKNDVDPSTWKGRPPQSSHPGDTILIDNRRHRTNPPQISTKPTAVKRKGRHQATTSKKEKGKARAQTPSTPPAKRHRAPMETRSKKGKEKLRTPTPTPPPEVEFAPPHLDDGEVGAQAAFIDCIAPPVPPREIGIGEAGPSAIPASTFRPLISLVPYAVSPSPPPIGDDVPFDPDCIIPMPGCISTSNDEEDEELVLQMLLDD